MEVKSIHQLLFPYYLLHSKPYRHTVVRLFVLSCPPLPPRPREVVPPLSLHTTPVLLQLLLSTLFTGRPLQVPELEVYPALSLVQLLDYCALLDRELQSAEIFLSTERSYYRGPL